MNYNNGKYPPPCTLKQFEICTYGVLCRYIASDLFRYMTSTSIKAFLRAWYITGFRYTFFMRLCKYYSRSVMYKPLFLVSRIALRHYSIKYGYQIPWQTNIGPGLYIGHTGTIIVNPNSTIGINCNISAGCLLGQNRRIDDNGNFIGFEYPVIGDRVFLGNSCKVIGGCEISDDSLIGVNTIVTKNVPPNSVVVGIPGKVVSNEGSFSFVGSIYPWTENLNNAT